MAKFVPDAVLDDMLDIYAEADTLIVCSGQPANHAGIAAVALADVTLTPGVGNGDFAVSNGDTSGRKLTVAAQNGVTVDNTGNATHIVLAVSGTSTLLHVTTCTTQTLTEANTVNVPAYDIEMLDVTP
jgi:hypothetical protein